MKRKRMKQLGEGKTARCYFCKTNRTNAQLVGGNHGGKPVCDECYKRMQQEEQKTNWEDSEGERQAYSSYGVY